MQAEAQQKLGDAADSEHSSSKVILLQMISGTTQSPDLNPREILWNNLKREIHTRHPKIMAELKQFCEEEWFKVPPEHSAGVINSYGRSLLEVIGAKGGTTDY